MSFLVLDDVFLLVFDVVAHALKLHVGSAHPLHLRMQRVQLFQQRLRMMMMRRRKRRRRRRRKEEEEQEERGERDESVRGRGG